MKKLALFTFVYICNALSTPVYNAHETCIVFDQKYVLSEHSRPGVHDFKALAKGKTVKKLPTIMYLLTFKFKKIKKQGFEVAHKIKGTANIVHEVLQWMKDKRYGDLTSLEKEILQASIPCHPRKDVINLCKELRRSGCTLLVDSDMDTIHSEVHINKMKQLGCDMSWLSGSITLTPYDIARRAVRARHKAYIELENNQFVVQETKHTLKRYEITQEIAGNDKHVVFVTHDPKIAQTARKAGFDAIVLSSADQLRREFRMRKLL